jgi:hypothetical protein
VFLPCPPRAWFTALEELLALAEAVGDYAAEHEEPEGGEAPVMPSAAKEAAGVGERANLPRPEPYPIHLASVSPEVVQQLRPLDGAGAGGGGQPADQYVTRDQVAAFVQRHKETVADWFNKDEHAAQAAVEGGGGKRHEYLWREVRPWLEKKSGRLLTERFPDLVPA